MQLFTSAQTICITDGCEMFGLFFLWFTFVLLHDFTQFFNLASIVFPAAPGATGSYLEKGRKHITAEPLINQMGHMLVIGEYLQ